MSRTCSNSVLNLYLAPCQHLNYSQSTLTWFIQKYFWTAKWFDHVLSTNINTIMINWTTKYGTKYSVSCKRGWNGRNGEGSGSDGASHQTQQTCTVTAAAATADRTRADKLLTDHWWKPKWNQWNLGEAAPQTSATATEPKKDPSAVRKQPHL